MSERVEKREHRITETNGKLIMVDQYTDLRAGDRITAADYTEQVERERDELREALAQPNSLARRDTVLARAERDQARAELKVADQQIIDLQDERDEARADCKEAVEALEIIATHAALDHRERGINEAQRYLIIARDVIDTGLSSYTQDEKEEQ